MNASALRILAVAAMVAVLGLAATACNGSSSDSGQVVEWSLVEPLTREDVGLGSLDDTADDTFPDLVTESAGAGRFMTVRLDLPDGEPFVQDHARIAAADLSRLDAASSHSVRVVTDEFTLDEAEEMLRTHGERFGFDVARIGPWKAEASDFLAANDSGRLDLNLNVGELDYLDISASASANASSDDVLIEWYFTWAPVR